MNSLSRILSAVAGLALFVHANVCLSAILNWQTGETIPGTESIVPGTAVQLQNWNTEQRNLRYANFTGKIMLSARFIASWLDNARFDNTELMYSYFDGAQATNASFRNAKMYEIRFKSANVSGADFTNSKLSDANFELANATGADFSGADLTDVNLLRATLANAKFDDAIIDRVDLSYAAADGRGFTASQFYSTRSYKRKSLQSIQLRFNDLTGWDFSQQDLRGSNLQASVLSNANFNGADLTRHELRTSRLDGATFQNARVIGTQFHTSVQASQISQTRSFQEKDLRGISMQSRDLSNWDLTGQNLLAANFRSSNLVGANFSGANLAEADLSQTTGLQQAQFSAATTYDPRTKWPAGFDPAAFGLTLRQTVEGDYNDDGQLNEVDLEALRSMSRSSFGIAWTISGNPDVDRDGRVNFNDLDDWVTTVKRTWYGDSNWDGEFNSSDLVLVWQAGQYEDDTIGNSNWATGDWDGDGDFNPSDLVMVFNSGGFERGRFPGANAVPEPSLVGRTLLGLFAVGLRRGRHRRN